MDKIDAAMADGVYPPVDVSQAAMNRDIYARVQHLEELVNMLVATRGS